MTNEQAAIPQLRYQDQTPISNKADNKRLSSILSPITDELTQIEGIIDKTMEKLLPQMVSRIKDSLIETIQSIVGDAVSRVKTEMVRVVEELFNYEQRCSDLMVKSETQLLESYNKRENIRVGWTSGSHR